MQKHTPRPHSLAQSAIRTEVVSAYLVGIFLPAKPLVGSSINPLSYDRVGGGQDGDTFSAVLTKAFTSPRIAICRLLCAIV